MKYELDVWYLTEIEGSLLLGYYSYGHHEKKLFAEAVKGDFDPKQSIEEIISRTVHKWVKSVPWCGTSQIVFVYSKEYKKGYRPITLCEV